MFIEARKPISDFDARLAQPSPAPTGSFTSKLAPFIARLTPGNPARLGKLLAAGGLLGLAAWVSFPSLFNIQSSKAMVNAHVRVIASPIAGTLALGEDLRQGNRVEAGRRLGAVDNAAVPSQLAHVDGELAARRTELATVRAQRATLEQLRAELARSGNDYKALYLSRLDSLIKESEAETASLRKTLGYKERDLTRRQTLARGGTVSPAEIDRLTAERDSLRDTLAARQNTLVRLRKERAAAEKGVFMADSYNNTPYARQREDEVRMTLASVDSQIAALETRIATLEADRRAEMDRVQRQGHADLTAPAGGYVWEQLAFPGAYVREAQPVLRVVDCRDAFLDVALSQSRVDSLKVGDRVTVWLSGDRTPHTGKISAIRSADPSEEALAVPTSQLNRSPGTLQVMVALPEETLAGPGAGSSDHRFCQIGRRATVDFASRE